MRIDKARRAGRIPFWELLLMGMLLLVFMDFKLYSLHLMVLAFVFFLLVRGGVYLPNGVIPPVILTIALCIFWSASFASPTAIAKRLVWPAAFLLGYNLFFPDDESVQAAERAEDKANVYIGIASIGFFIHLALNVYANAGQGESIDRNALDFWSMARRAATGQAGLACVPLAWCISSLVKEEKFLRKLPALAVLGVVMYYNLTLGSRTIIFLFALLLLAAVVYLVKAKTVEKKKRRTLLWIAGFAMLVALAYSFNVGGLRELVEESILGNRLIDEGGTQISSDSRWTLKLKHLKLMPQYMFGGNYIRRAVGGYAHDVLLDTYDEAGFVALLAVVALLWDSVSKLRLLLRSEYIKFETKLTVLCVYLSIYVQFALEPILAGMPWLLMAFCFFHGMVTQLAKSTALLERRAAESVDGKRIDA